MDNFDNDKIDNFVRGLMSDLEREEFNQEVEQDDALKAEVEFHQDVASIVRKRKALQLVTAELEADHFFSEAKPEEQSEAKVVNLSKRRSGSIRRYLAYAASLLVLVVAGLGFINTQYSNSGLTTFDANNLASNSMRTVTSDTNADPFKEGIQAMEQKDFAQAITFFEAIPEDSENYTSALLYLATAQYEAENYEDAITSAETLLAQESKSATMRFDAEWLFVQSKLAQGELDTAFETQLEAIATNDSHDYQMEAQELQAQLNSFWRKLVFKK